jgi:hypothetical protein
MNPKVVTFVETALEILIFNQFQKHLAQSKVFFFQCCNVTNLVIMNKWVSQNLL